MGDLDTRLRDYYASEPLDLAARRRLAAMITAPPLVTNRRAVVAAVVGVAVLALVLSVALPQLRSSHTPAGQVSMPAQLPTDHGALTDREFAVAYALARQRADAKYTRSVSSATATVGKGIVVDSNTGHRCTSGRLLHIMVIGEFNIVHGGVPVPSGSSGPPPLHPPVVAVLITADPRSGYACLIRVQPGPVTPDPGATVLFAH